MLKSIYADLHIHIGRASNQQPVKITASRQMTFENIVKESRDRKGVHLIGVVDTQSPAVQEDISRGLQSHLYQEHPDGGIIYNGLTCLLGAEIEFAGPNGGVAHVLVYLPHFDQMKSFTNWLKKHMKNVQLSTQRIYCPIIELQEKVHGMGGLFIPAHVFTPFKSIYGKLTNRMADVIQLNKVNAIELGLSSDSPLADSISELNAFPFLTNSDAHSVSKIAREYNQLDVKEPSFAEFKLALEGKEERKITANFGLDPKLGKYYRSTCDHCNQLWDESLCKTTCISCGHNKMNRGVSERIQEISDQKTIHPPHRPAYYYQIPLEFIPGLGKKGIEKLYSSLGTEMDILHHVPLSELEKVTTPAICDYIEKARSQRLTIQEGGGGTYGKLVGLTQKPC